MKKISNVLFAGALAWSVLGAPTVFAEDTAAAKTVAALHKEKATLAGKTVSVQGNVVKVNNGIMGRNFVHVRDGTGDESSNNLIVTSKQTAAVGDKVAVKGLVVLNRDFGSGYSYPLLLEQAEITPAK